MFLNFEAGNPEQKVVQLENFSHPHVRKELNISSTQTSL